MTQGNFMLFIAPFALVLFSIWADYAIKCFSREAKVITTRCGNGQVMVTEIAEKRPSVWPPVMLSALFIALAIVLYMGV